MLDRSEQSLQKYKSLMKDGEFAALIAPCSFGKGTARRAFAVPTNHDVIVKESIQPCPTSNFIEWIIWASAVEIGGQLQKVLGQCIAISESGRYLMMERLDDITKDDYADIPDVPTWFTDPKPSAFGKRNGVIKIRDYGLVKWDRLVMADMTRPPAFATDARVARSLKEWNKNLSS